MAFHILIIRGYAKIQKNFRLLCEHHLIFVHIFGPSGKRGNGFDHSPESRSFFLWADQSFIEPCEANESMLVGFRSFTSHGNPLGEEELLATKAALGWPSTEKFFLPDRADGARREMRLLLNREPLKPSTGQTNQVR